MKISHILGFDNPFPVHIDIHLINLFGPIFFVSEHSNGQKSQYGGYFEFFFIFSSQRPFKNFLARFIDFLVFC